MQGINQALSGLLWDLSGFNGVLIADSAVIAAGSSLVGLDSGSWTYGDDLSGQWAFKDAINAGSSGLGSYGVGAIGDINFGEDTFGVNDIIDLNKTHVNPAPGGADFTIVNPNLTIFDGIDSQQNPDGFKRNGPMIQNSMVFTFDFSGGDLTYDMIANAQPIFGTEGAPLVPEPSTIFLLGSGLFGLALYGRRRKSIKS